MYIYLLKKTMNFYKHDDHINMDSAIVESIMNDLG